MSPEEKKRDRYYRRKYGVGLLWYNLRFKLQGGCCGICRRPQSGFKYRFAVDHAHDYRKVQIHTGKENGNWQASAGYCGAGFSVCSNKKSEAVKIIRLHLKIRSCRGLLCPQCNRGLRFYADCPTRLANASQYLKEHQNAN